MEALAGALAAKLAERLPAAIDEALSRAGLPERIEALAARLEPEARPEPDGPPRSGAPPAGRSRPAIDKQTCSEPGCDLPARARGLCSKHYQRLRYAEKRAIEQGQPPPTNLAEARAARNHKQARKTDKRGGGVCSKPGCERPNYAKGMCGKHFMEWVRAQKSNDQ